MGKIKKPASVKLIIGFIFQDKNIFDKALAQLARRFGKTDFISPIIPFNLTDYYKNEIGDGLSKKIVSFEKLIDPSRLAEIKILTNKIEERFAESGCRRINIDPGYIDLSKLVLATTKDYSHRIYLKKGIYAEITLSYRDKNFQALPWTYPDYKTKEYSDIFSAIRQKYANELSFSLSSRATKGSRGI